MSHSSIRLRLVTPGARRPYSPTMPAPLPSLLPAKSATKTVVINEAAKKAPAKKTPANKAPAKKSAAKKVPARNAAATTTAKPAARTTAARKA